MNAGMPAGRLLEAPGDPAFPDGAPDMVPASPAMNGIGHYDFVNGQFTVHALPQGDTAQEVEFVPAYLGAPPEGVGYLLALVNRVAERHSDLLIFDAEDVGAGPLGGYKLPVRLSTIHGTWMPEHQLGL